MRFTQSSAFSAAKARRASSPTPADLGTCFGMEASLEAYPENIAR